MKEYQPLSFFSNNSTYRLEEQNIKLQMLLEEILTLREDLPSLIQTDPTMIPVILLHPDERVHCKITNLLLKLMVKTDPTCISLILTSHNEKIRSKINYYLLKFMIDETEETIPLIFANTHLLSKVDTFLLEIMLLKSNVTVNYLLEQTSENLLKCVNKHRIKQMIEKVPSCEARLTIHPSPSIKIAYSEYLHSKQKLKLEEEREQNTLKSQDRKTCMLF